MFKRLLLGLGIIAGLLTPAYSAGTVPGVSLSQQLDEFGKPLANCKLYVIQAGTVSTPQNAYQDSGLTLLLPNPMTCNASGRLPQFFVADGNIKLRLDKSNGTNVFTYDGLLVVGASSGGGGGSPVDATTILATGDLKARYGTGILSGFVRANGRTIGSATSGATERANLDCQALFQYLWDTDANLSVSGGRGASSAADWAANKTITLPDWRGRALAFLDDMGNSAAGRLTSSYFGTSATVLGAAGGREWQTLSIAQLPVVNLSSLFNGGSPWVHDHTYQRPSTGIDLTPTGGALSVSSRTVFIDNTSTATMPSLPTFGSGSAHSIIQPTMLATIYIKI